MLRVGNRVVQMSGSRGRLASEVLLLVESLVELDMFGSMFGVVWTGLQAQNVQELIL